MADDDGVTVAQAREHVSRYVADVEWRDEAAIASPAQPSLQTGHPDPGFDRLVEHSQRGAIQLGADRRQQQRSGLHPPQT